ncbi:DDE-type integrase/transposase/recombinase [Sphingomonas sp. PB2P19]
MRVFRHWRWHLDEMYVRLNGEMVYLWRAVDHEGEILESDLAPISPDRFKRLNPLRDARAANAF